jgi:chromosomal replication initiation ATPase DnaA
MHLQIINARLDALRIRGAVLPQQNPLILKRIIEYAIGMAFEVEALALHAPTRGPAATAFARQVGMYLAHVACGLSLSDIGRIFDRDRTTVAHACGVVEDRRDDPCIDRTLDLLEAVVGRLTHVTLRGSSHLN